MVNFNNDYYSKVINQYGYDPLEVESIQFSLGKLRKEDLKTQWICHYHADKFAKYLERDKEKSIVTTGFGLSGPPHIGTISQIMKAIRLQENGISVQVVLGDLDAVNGKSIDYFYTQELVEKYKYFIRELGFDLNDNSILRSQTEKLDVLKTAYLLGHEIEDGMFNNTEEDLHEFYSKRGKVDSEMTYRRKLSLNLMIADFFDLFESGFQAVLVYLGIDEHRYVRMAKELFQKLREKDRENKGLVFSSMYSSIIKGLNGFPKMSKSFPESGINVDMNSDEIFYKLMNEDCSEKMPEENVVFQMLTTCSYFSFDEIMKAYKSYVDRDENWNKLKEQYIEQLIDICSKWPN